VEVIFTKVPSFFRSQCENYFPFHINFRRNVASRQDFCKSHLQEELVPPIPAALKKWVHSILAPNPLLLRRMGKPLSGLALLNPGERFKHNRGQRPLPARAFYIRIQIIFDISNFRHFSSFSSGNSGIPPVDGGGLGWG